MRILDDVECLRQEFSRKCLFPIGIGIVVHTGIVNAEAWSWFILAPIR